MYHHRKKLEGCTQIMYNLYIYILDINSQPQLVQVVFVGIQKTEALDALVAQPPSTQKVGKKLTWSTHLKLTYC